MTTRPEALRAAGEARDAAAIRALLADLPETDRAELLPLALEIVAAGTKQPLGTDLAPMLLVAYGILPVTEIRKLGWRSNHAPKDLVTVLRGRSPERLDPIVTYLLADFGTLAWAAVRPLVREGIVPRPDGPSYTIAMLAATRYRSAAELVADDPALLEVEAWRLFEVEGGGEDSLANHEKFFGDTWGGVFRDVAARDPAARDRLLDASLAALARDFAQYCSGWFSRFHESLAPTDDERAARVDLYLGLVRSRVGPTVSMAVAALGRVQAAGRLPANDLLDRIGPVLADGSAGTAKAALGLVRRAATEGSAVDARRAAMVAAEALANGSPEVQRAAIELIGRLSAARDEAVARAVAERLPGVAASQRPGATALLARLGGEGPVGVLPAQAAARPAPPAAARPSGTDHDRGDSQAARSAPPRPSRTDHDHDRGHSQVARSAPPRPSPTDPDRAIESIDSLDALVDVAVSVLETGEPAADIERVLEAIGRMGGERPDGFGRLTAPIAKRARTLVTRRDRMPFRGFDARADVAALLLAWTAGEVVEPGRSRRSDIGGAGAFLSARAREVAEAAAAGRAFRSVALPTHRGGWIDPAVLVGRLTAARPPSTIDLVAAILRLAPSGRADALDAARGLTGEVGTVVRYALGGDGPIGETAPWWVAAARVRAPGDDDPAVERRHPGLGPNAGRAATVGTGDPRSYRGGLGLEVDPPAVDPVSFALPTVLMLRDPSSFGWTAGSEPAMFRWMATIQPGDREPWAAIGSLLLARNTDWWSAEWANRVFLEPFIDPITSIGPHARVLLGVALGAKEAGERGLAADVVGSALGDERMTPPDLAEALSEAARIGCDRPNRWALSLADVAALSNDHAAAVASAVGRTMPALAERPPGKLVPLLRLLDETSAASGSAPDPAAGPPLSTIAATGGEAGRLARSILGRG